MSGAFSCKSHCLNVTVVAKELLACSGRLLGHSQGAVFAMTLLSPLSTISDIYIRFSKFAP